MTDKEVIQWLVAQRDKAVDFNVELTPEIKEIRNRVAAKRREAYDVAIRAIEQTRWIPVSERLPEADERIGNVARYYLVQNEYGDMLVARYTHREYEYWEQIYQLQPISDEIVAWMPLPKPYKEEECDG